MKTKMLVLVCLLGTWVLFLSYGYSSAQSGGALSRIGTVNIEDVSKNCDATKVYAEKANAEFKKMTDEEDKLNLAIQALQTELDSGALKVGTQDYFDRYRELAQKKSQLGYLKDFNTSEMALKNQLWKMDLYKKILDIANKIGKEKDLYLVLAVEEPDLSPQKAEEFPNIVRSHKILYSGGCADLTKEVIEKLNQETQAGN